jgi:AMP nucleosidase
VARWFPTTDLAGIGDETADGLWNAALDATRPLGLFDALRTDFSLARLAHYTGAPAEHVQSYILFTNYHRYVDYFVKWACEQLQDPASGYTQLSCAGGVVVAAITGPSAPPSAQGFVAAMAGMGASMGVGAASSHQPAASQSTMLALPSVAHA